MRFTSPFRRTKIVCTIGPRTSSPEEIEKLIRSGMNVARLNFSHGDRESHRKTIHMLRDVSKSIGQEIGILQDLGGPKIRLGFLKKPEMLLERGTQVALSPEGRHGPDDVPVNYPHLLEDIHVGDLILLADGTVQVTVREVQENRAICDVIASGVIRSQKGVNLPSSHLRINAFTEKDRKDLVIGLEEEVDFVALSFVRTENDLKLIRDVLDRQEKPPHLIAKIEKPQAVESFEKILEKVDGVMVARGDLGVEMPLEEVPIIQKKIIRLARQAGKPVITATQMLTSMLDSPRPTRAEATDVANAILDGTDALMLSDETTVGSYPMESVSVLDRIARTTERYLGDKSFMDESTTATLPGTAAAISRAACWLAIDLEAAAIVASTSSGGTARLVSRFRPPCPVIGLTDCLKTQRQLSLSWGVIPNLVQSFSDTDQMFDVARTWALKAGVAMPWDRLIITAGVPVGVSGTTNLLKVVELDQET